MTAITSLEIADGQHTRNKSLIVGGTRKNVGVPVRHFRRAAIKDIAATYVGISRRLCVIERVG
jgi:hypothetical protein